MHSGTHSGKLARYDMHNVGNERADFLPEDRENPVRQRIRTQGASRDLGPGNKSGFPQHARGRSRNEAEIAIAGISFSLIGLE
jgi:hypothetical protein